MPNGPILSSAVMGSPYEDSREVFFLNVQGGDSTYHQVMALYNPKWVHFYYPASSRVRSTHHIFKAVLSSEAIERGVEPNFIDSLMDDFSGFGINVLWAPESDFFRGVQLDDLWSRIPENGLHTSIESWPYVSTPGYRAQEDLFSQLDGFVQTGLQRIVGYSHLNAPPGSLDFDEVIQSLDRTLKFGDGIERANALMVAMLNRDYPGISIGCLIELVEYLSWYSELHTPLISVPERQLNVFEQNIADDLRDSDPNNNDVWTGSFLRFLLGDIFDLHTFVENGTEFPPLSDHELLREQLADRSFFRYGSFFPVPGPNDPRVLRFQGEEDEEFTSDEERRRTLEALTIPLIPRTPLGGTRNIRVPDEGWGYVARYLDTMPASTTAEISSGDEVPVEVESSGSSDEEVSDPPAPCPEEESMGTDWEEDEDPSALRSIGMGAGVRLDEVPRSFGNIRIGSQSLLPARWNPLESMSIPLEDRHRVLLYNGSALDETSRYTGRSSISDGNWIIESRTRVGFRPVITIYPSHHFEGDPFFYCHEHWGLSTNFAPCNVESLGIRPNEPDVWAWQELQRRYHSLLPNNPIIRDGDFSALWNSAWVPYLLKLLSTNVDLDSVQRAFAPEIINMYFNNRRTPEQGDFVWEIIQLFANERVEQGNYWWISIFFQTLAPFISNPNSPSAESVADNTARTMYLLGYRNPNWRLMPAENEIEEIQREVLILIHSTSHQIRQRMEAQTSSVQPQVENGEPDFLSGLF